MNFFKTTLKQYCQSDFPELAEDEKYLEERSEAAAKAYSHAIRHRGLPHTQAISIAYDELYQNLLFSPIAFVRDVLENEFEEIVNDQSSIQKMAETIARKDSFKGILNKYEIDERGQVMDEDSLYSEVTGLVAEELQNSSKI